MSKLKAEELVVSNWLKTQLAKKSMSPGELATKLEPLGIARSAVYYYVSGERIPSKEIAEKLATALGSTVPEYKLRKVGRPREKFKSRDQIFKKVIGNINAAKRDATEAEKR